MLTPAAFPASRPRRLRRTPWMRHLVQEVTLEPRQLIWPLFVTESDDIEPIRTMLGVVRYPIAHLVRAVADAKAAGIEAVALFPVVPPTRKSDDAAEAFRKDNLVNRAIAAIKSAVPDIGVIADVALDPYTSHGHDGLLKHGDVDNDATVDALCRQATLLADAGADVLAPSDMMDGRIGRIRTALDASGHAQLPLLSYAAKYASHLYGPFRDAVGSASALKGDKRTYQMNPANRREAMVEAALDVAEGADMLMVKPAIHYLDIIHAVAAASPVPVLAYQVSGEYGMLRFAAEQGCFDFMATMEESLLSCIRAGATAVFTYAALDMARRL